MRKNFMDLQNTRNALAYWLGQAADQARGHEAVDGEQYDKDDRDDVDSVINLVTRALDGVRALPRCRSRGTSRQRRIYATIQSARASLPAISGQSARAALICSQAMAARLIWQDGLPRRVQQEIATGEVIIAGQEVV